MNNKIDEWSDERPYYMLYQDKKALKNIYAQLNIELPDVGEIAYIGTNTHRQSKDYSFNGENGILRERKKDITNDKICIDNKNEKREKAGILICDVNEASEIREYANINEIKEMNNMLFYRQILRSIIKYCKAKDKYPICYMKAPIELYDAYEERDDIFVKMNGDCIWLKRENMDTSVENIANIMGDVCLVGYIVEQARVDKPRIIKGLVIYT